jgi:Ca2+/Na+ antiporter
MECANAMKLRLLFVFVGMFLLQAFAADWLWENVPFGSTPNTLLSLFSASGVTLVSSLFWCKHK